MITFRAMTEDDVPAAVEAFDRGFLAMMTRHNLPVTRSSILDERYRQDRTRHLLRTDPHGSWVAVSDDGTVVGMAQALVREGYWTLSQIGTLPGRQGHGVGRELLRLALAYGDPGGPGTIQCSRDPKAMALYTSCGFQLHPVVAAWGTMRPGSVTYPPEVRRCEPDQVGRGELEIVATIDRARRGSSRTADILAMLSRPGTRLLLHEDQAYAVARDERIVTLGGHQDESARLVLRAMLAETPPGETIQVNWLTSGQQWAISEVVSAGIELVPYGPIMVRGMDAPPRPYIPSSGFG